MQDEMNRKTIALIMKGSKVTADLLVKGMKYFINEYKKYNHHEMTLRKLLSKGEGATSIELGSGDIAGFRKIARKYNIDFAIKLDKTTNPPTHLAFFKAKETDIIAQAFKEFIAENDKRKNRVSFKQKLQEKKEIIKQQPKTKTIEKNIDRVRGKER